MQLFLGLRDIFGFHRQVPAPLFPTGFWGVIPRRLAERQYLAKVEAITEEHVSPAPPARTAGSGEGASGSSAALLKHIQRRRETAPIMGGRLDAQDVDSLRDGRGMIEMNVLADGENLPSGYWARGGYSICCPGLGRMDCDEVWALGFEIY